MALTTAWPLGPAGPDSGKMTPTLIGSPVQRTGASAGMAKEAAPAVAATVN